MGLLVDANDEDVECAGKQQKKPQWMKVYSPGTD